MVPGLPGQGVNGNSSPAVGPIETMVPGLPGQKVNGNSSPAVGPIETMLPGFQSFLSRKLTVICSSAVSYTHLRAHET